MAAPTERQLLNLYLKEIRYTMLTPIQEQQLSFNIQNNPPDSEIYKESVQTLVSSNLRYVVTVARSYENKGLPLHDLINEGNIGLIEAAKRYDYATYKTKFITCAVQWIRQSILLALSEHTRTVRLPLNVNNQYNEFKKIIDKMLAKSGSYNLNKVAELMMVPVTDLINLEKNMKRGLSFDEPIPGEDDDSKTRIDVHVAETDRDKYEVEHENLQLHNALKMLKPRERNIIMDYYGIDREYALAKEELAEKHDLTVTMISKIIRDTRDILKYLITKK